MVDPTFRGEIVELRPHSLELSQRTADMLDELARLLDVPLAIAAQLAIANTLNTVQKGHAIHVTWAWDPGHKSGPSDG